jgi:sulfite reductase (NADPH) flavoprotein alpha-component
MPPMSALAPAPFAEDQLETIERLLREASPEQLQWLSGYLAGFQAARGERAAPAPAAPPASKAKLTVLYGTESGNSEALAGAARKAASRLGFAAKMLDMADATPASLNGENNLLVIASTWGEGDPPQRAEAFYAALMAEDAPRLPKLRYSVLALGDRAYANFCETGKRIDQRLEALGATRLAARVDCDLDYETPAKGWIDARLRELQEDPSGGAVIHVDFARAAAVEGWSRANPFQAEITERINLNSSRSSTATWHLELSLAGSGIAYEPGDSLGVVPRNDPALVEEVLKATGLATDDALRVRLTDQLDVTTLMAGQVEAYAALTGDTELKAIAADPARLAEFTRDRQVIDLLEAAPGHLAAEQLTSLLRPLPPRYYSIASSRQAVGEEAHLLVAPVRWESHGRRRNGVVSVDIAERRTVGNTPSVFLKPNTHFRLPADPEQKIIMVGPGTGVAPFRAFMQQRESTGASGESWLFFGARNFTHDFLYQLEWQDWVKSGVLTRMDVAFSRDQREKIYVQHRMWQARRELFAWLADGAALYVCGDANAMDKDVHATLLRIIADQAGTDEAGAVQYLRGLQKAGRYLRDVY